MLTTDCDRLQVISRFIFSVIFLFPLFSSSANSIETSRASQANIILIEGDVPDYQSLVAAIGASNEVHILDASTDGLTQIAKILGNHDEVDAIHLISHGDLGSLHLGALELTERVLKSRSAELSALSQVLKRGGDILLYGCNVAKGDGGQRFVKQLADVTGANVAASTNSTGGSYLGGDWRLEFAVGSIAEKSLLDFSRAGDYRGLLGSYGTQTVSSFTDQGATLTDAASLGASWYVISGSASMGVDPSGGFLDAPSTQDQPGNTITVSADGTNLTQFALTGLSVSEFEAADIFQNIVVTGNLVGGGTVTGSISNGSSGADTYVASLSNFSGQAITSFTITFDAIDNGGANTFIGNLTLVSFTTASPNTAPTIGGASAGQMVNDTSTVSPFSSITIADADGDNVTTTVTLDTNAKGVFTSASLTASGFTGSGPYTHSSSTPSAAQTAIRQLVFNPTDNRVAAGSTETTTFTIGVNDGTTTTNNSTTTVVSTSVNDAPVITSNGGGATASTSVNENSTAVTTVTASDADPSTTLTYSISGGLDQALFSINSSSGALVFASAPNYESPGDNGANNVYDVQVTVTDDGPGTLADVQDIAVTVNNINDAPVITSDGGGATASVNAAENQTAVTTLTATDQDTADTLTYSISGGADQALFSINSSTGVLTFASAPNYESPTDSGTNGVYDVQVTVTDNGAGTLTDTQAIAVTVTNVNEAPVITSNGGGSTASTSVNENSTAVTTVTATDVDTADTLTYSISGGADQALFSINSSSGALVFASAPNYESPTDSGANNVYDVQVTVTDNGSGTLTDVQSIAVTVNNINDSPIITSDGGGASATVNAAENQTAVTTVTATDQDTADTLTYSISGGADQALFSINSSTGVLTFASAPNYESPTDSGTNGVYDVQVTVTDNGAGTLSDTQAIAVTVTNVNEPPVITNLNGDSTSFVVGGSAILLDLSSNATLSDVDNPVDLNGGNVTALVGGNPYPTEDVLSVGNIGNISISGSNVNHSDGVTIGTVAGGSSGSNLVITLNANATLARVRDLLSALQYQDSNSTSSNVTTRSVSITVDDGDGGNSTSASQVVSVSLIRAPIIDLDGNDSSGGTNGGYNGIFTEDGGAVPAADSDSVITGDIPTYKLLTVTLINHPDGTSESLSSTYGTGAQTVNSEAVTISSYNSTTGVLTITIDDGSTSAATMQLLISSMRYNNSSNAPDTTNRSITFVGTDTADNVGPASTAHISIVRTNDPVAGSVTITGTTMQWQTLTADASSVSDPDGLGTFSYQWKRNGSSITGATASTYTLARADVGANITVTVSFVDAGGSAEAVTSSATAAIVGDLDGDTIADSSDPDIDGDGMSNVYEDANGLNSRDASDRDTDLDSDGVSNYNESVAGTHANVDDYPPTVTPPADITANATGLFTAVTIGSASASDDKDGVVSATVTLLNGKAVSSMPTYFKPGVNTVTWSASDAAGNTATANQTVNVIPLVELSKDQISAEGATVTFKAILNGSAVTYPVGVPYTVGGTASTDGSDHNLTDGVITITGPNLESSVSFSLVNDGPGEGVESVVITIGTPTNAVVGPHSTHTVQIYEGNVAPSVALTANQGGGGATRIVTQTGGTVVVTAAVTDPNPGDSHTYDWSASDNSLIDTDSTAQTFTFDPSGLTPGLYGVRLTVSDGTDTTEVSLDINVVAAAPVLTTADSDGDGINDVTEGNGDADGDGVADYLDALSSSNTLQQKRAVSDQFIMETEPGLKLSLGSTAFLANNGQAGVTESEIEALGNRGAGSSGGRGYNFINGLFDFTVEELPVAGQSVQVVLPQLAAIPPRALYRKQMATGWATFSEDSNNSVASAPGSEGYCPPPGDGAYTAGLIAGYWCVQLTIEDGGPNDADGAVNKAVNDPGGVGTLAIEPITVTITGSGGSGAISYWMLLLLSLGFVMRRRRAWPLLMLPLMVMSGNAMADDPSSHTYVGLSYLAVKSDERGGDFQADLNALGLTATVTQTDLSRSGWSPYIGYQVDKNFAIELGYVDLGKVTTVIDGSTSDVNAYLATASAVHPITASGYTFNFVLRKTLHERLDAIVKYGALFWKADYTLASATASRSFSDDSLDVNFGVGLEYAVTPKVPLRVSWSSYRFADANVNAWEWGIGYRF